MLASFTATELRSTPDTQWLMKSDYRNSLRPAPQDRFVRKATQATRAGGCSGAPADELMPMGTTGTTGTGSTLSGRKQVFLA
jgi:hypothetical protein